MARATSGETPSACKASAIAGIVTSAPVKSSLVVKEPEVPLWSAASAAGLLGGSLPTYVLCAMMPLARKLWVPSTSMS